MRSAKITGLLAGAVLGLGLLSPASASAADAYPVYYDYPGLAAAGAAQLTNPGGAPPGANNWSCKPSAAHPRPVVLVHGFTANMTVNWNTMSPMLANAGYCVFALTYGVPPGTPFPLDQIGGRNLMEQSAAELATFIDKVLAATGVSKVDIVGHSEGSLMPDYYVKFLGGASKVDKYVGMTPLWDGTQLLGLDQFAALGRAFGLGPVIDLLTSPAPASQQFLHGSAFLAKLNAGGAAVTGVSYTMIMTRFDELVQPYSSGYLTGTNVHNYVLQDLCPLDFAGHGMVGFDPNAAQLIRNALDPANARPVQCSYVSPSP